MWWLVDATITLWYNSKTFTSIRTFWMVLEVYSMSMGSLRCVHGWIWDGTLIWVAARNLNFAQLLLNMIISRNLGGFEPRIVYQVVECFLVHNFVNWIFLLEVLSFGVTVKNVSVQKSGQIWHALPSERIRPIYKSNYQKLCVTKSKSTKHRTTLLKGSKENNALNQNSSKFKIDTTPA